jgi:type VI secretion system secreted protein VgrG
MAKLMEIVTPLGPDVMLLHKMRGTEEMSRLSEYELDLLSSKIGINLADVLGKTVTIKLMLENGEVRHFSGFVTRISQGGMHGRFYSYRATVRPWLWFLTRTTNCRIFQEKKVPDILKAIFDQHSSIADVKFELTETYTEWNYCVQYLETDFAFVSRLMEDEGIYYYFRHEGERHTLVLADSYSAHSPMPGYKDIPYIAPEQLARAEREHVREWTLTQELQPGKYALTDYDFEKPRVDLQVKSAIKRDHALAEYEIYDYPGDYSKRDDGQQYVRNRIQELQAKFERVQATTTARGIGPGCLFNLKQHPRADQNAEYLIISAEYLLESSEHEAMEKQGGASFNCTFTALNSKQPFRPERTTEKPIVQGPQTALVVGASGEDIYTDKFGRVKVHFYWDRYGKKDENSSCWIRVSQNWGGKGWGGMFIPHVGQEVIVEFLEGDPDNPLITGRVYNADNMPPVALPGGKSQSIIKDHGGNHITMEGAAGGQKMTLHSPTHQTTFTLGNSIVGFTESFGKFTYGGDFITQVGKDRNTEVQGKSTSLTHGDSLTMVWGTSTSLIKGASYQSFLGESIQLVVGLYSETFLGAKISSAAPFQIEWTRGWKLNKANAKNFDISPSSLRKITNLKAVYKSQMEKVDEARMIFNSKTEKVKGAFKAISGTWDQIIEGKVEIKADGVYQVDADGNAEIKSGAELLLEGKSGIVMDAPTLKVKQKMDVGNGALTVSP